jgi:ATP-dependent Lon protease, bacterial type
MPKRKACFDRMDEEEWKDEADDDAECSEADETEEDENDWKNKTDWTLKEEAKLDDKGEAHDEEEKEDDERVRSTEKETDERVEHDLEEEFDEDGMSKDDKEVMNTPKETLKPRPRVSYLSEETTVSVPEQYQEEWKILQSFLASEEPTLEKILSAKLDRKEKAKLYRMFQRFQTSESQEEQDNMRKEINESLSKQSDDLVETEKYEEMEKKLLTIGKRTGNMKLKILNLPIPDVEKSILYQRYLRLENCPPLDSEKGKLTEWMYYALQIPRTLHPTFETLVQEKKYSEILSKAKQAMDKKMFGMDAVKEQILISFFDMITHPESSGHAMGIVGPAGTGKTQLVRALSEALSLPFEQISLGGINDASFIDGSSIVWEGSQPGIIVKKLIKMGHKNGILFFDEIDKLAGTEHGKEVSNVLLHITDFTQNNKFTDKYLGELDIDLSHVFFVFSMNDASLLDPILKDRIPLIYTPGYSLDQKVKIVQNYILPEELATREFSKDDITIPDSVVQYIISKHHIERQEGVRELKELISDLVKKINLQRMCGATPAKKKRKTSGYEGKEMSFSFSSSSVSFPLTLTQKHIDVFLPLKK